MAVVGWVRWTQGVRRPRTGYAQIRGLTLLTVELSPGPLGRRERQAVRLLRRGGISRALLPPELAGCWPGVDPLPLCRALAGELAMTLLEPVPLRERRVVLRAERADAAALELARFLCPRVGELTLDLRRGGELLADRLRREFGLAPLPPGEGVTLAVELDPREERGERTLRLWGTPELLGLEPRLEEDLPGDAPALPLLALLWETGRIKKEDILLAKP